MTCILKTPISGIVSSGKPLLDETLFVPDVDAHGKVQTEMSLTVTMWPFEPVSTLKLVFVPQSMLDCM